MNLKINRRYFAIGILLGIGLLWGIIRAFPDSRLHLVFCNVGQGNMVYIRFPDRSDGIIDTGPISIKALACLGRYMPFYDRSLNFMLITHPQKDHAGAAVDIIERYDIDHLIVVTEFENSQIYTDIKNAIAGKKTDLKYINSLDRFNIGEASLDFIWPDKDWLAMQFSQPNRINILGASSDAVNQMSPYILLKWEGFSALLTGDADAQAQNLIRLLKPQSIPERLTILQVPHHGSKNSLDNSFLEIIQPQAAVISVGKNSYGHPAGNTLDKLSGKQIYRTDTDGDVEIIVDEKGWRVRRRI